MHNLMEESQQKNRGGIVVLSHPFLKRRSVAASRGEMSILPLGMLLNPAGRLRLS